MFSELKSAAHRAAPTLIQDAVGAAALVVMFVVGLSLPALV
ncbi:hypothetical protein [Algirhabdus cladophorae]